MEPFPQFWWGIGDGLIKYGLTSIIFLVAILFLWAILNRLVFKTQSFSVETKRRWIVMIRNTLLLLSLLGIGIIWAPQMRTLAVTLVAIALALVFAVKELLLCLSGAYLRMAGKFFSTGDLIEINGIRGIVLDRGWLTLTLLEIGPGHTSQHYTGRALFLPNSMLLNGPLINETYTKKYILHTITIPLSSQDDWKSAEQILLQTGKTECQPFLEDAKRHMKKLEGGHWLDAPSVEPNVTIQLPDTGKLNLLLRIPCPPKETARLEQAILHQFLSYFRADQLEVREKTGLVEAV
ncbi:MAG: membrane protein [Nitrospirales bacterium]|nr:MAG: membrane protein [Nitrospirales bacterium]